MTSPITTHVLDTHLGRPAVGVPVLLERRRSPGGGMGSEEWQPLAEGETDADGRVADLLAGEEIEAGFYRLTFGLGAYFERTERSCFFPEAVLTFRIQRPEEHHHVPLLLSPFSYTTYRGS
ncbi:MAG: hydroxyisourate hydrolase [Holophagales bacterium]|nr:hydroxyisourate hydrolase [Holophagales bacterium]